MSKWNWERFSESAIEKWKIGELVFCAKRGPLQGVNGYVGFPKRPVREQGYHGIIAYVPVHGGITFADELEDCFVYGFDTAHHDSDRYPTTDLDWIKGQCRIMAEGIRKAAEVERNYLRCKTNEGKAKWAQQVLDVGEPGHWNFGIGVNLLFGSL